jgi:hypothetical protein
MNRGQGAPWWEAGQSGALTREVRNDVGSNAAS